jgi:AraC-like DNA-binding protein
MLPSSRGTLFPRELPEFHRLPPGTQVEHLVRWFWITRWNLPDGEISRQQVISYPALNLVVEDGGVGLAGPGTRVGHRDLFGSGWAVGVLLRPAAVPAFTDDPGALRDRYEPLDEPALHAEVAAVMADPSPAGRTVAAAALSAWLVARVGEPGDDALLANRLVAAAEDPAVQRVGTLAGRLATSERTVQRLARRYVGLTPAALIRRRRVQEAAERLRDDPGTDLAALATELGYTDQAHLTNEFSRVLGSSPAGYRRVAAPAGGPGAS